MSLSKLFDQLLISSSDGLKNRKNCLNVGNKILKLTLTGLLHTVNQNWRDLFLLVHYHRYFLLPNCKKFFLK